jgi:phosphoserine phosphatase
LEACAAVGNSCFDIPMLEMCGLGIAFNPEDKCVVQSADVVVKGKNLRDIIPVFESTMKT